jgi:hypothetical protein
MAVLGAMATGGGAATLSSWLSTMGIPSMTKATFTATERLISDALKSTLVEKMVEAGNLERDMAIARGDTHQGIPSITVVADGGWSKQSYKHSYNAKSGVAVIFGHETRKLLFLSVRNKFCSVCAVARNRNVQAPQYRCYQNWSLSSTAMESDMVAEGFRLSERQHGLRYMRLAGDGDSSVLYTIATTVPYGPHVKKIECANHACKGYRSRLEKLAKDHPEFRGKGGLTKRVIQRLTVGARFAIRTHSKTGNIHQLRHDLRNGPNHVFGNHTNCNPAFCKNSRAKQANDNSDSDESNTDDESPQVDVKEAMSWVETIDQIISDEIDDIPTATDIHDAQQNSSSCVRHIHPDLFRYVWTTVYRLLHLDHYAYTLILSGTSKHVQIVLSH